MENVIEDAGRVVVGVDGSKTSVRAAMWAAEEAGEHDSELMLLHVIDASRDGHETAMAEARHALNEAWEAVVDTGLPVKVASDIVEGDAAARLVEASRSARMICIGHKGIGDSKPERRGATAAEVARTADCTVAVIRHRKERSPFHQWVVAVLDETPGSHSVLQAALAEATLRHAPVLALTSWSTTGREKRRARTGLRKRLDRYLDDAKAADLQVCAIPMPDHILGILKQSASIDQLVVVDASNATLTQELMTPRAAKILRKSNCSTMFVRRDVKD